MTKENYDAHFGRAKFIILSHQSILIIKTSQILKFQRQDNYNLIELLYLKHLASSILTLTLNNPLNEDGCTDKLL